MKKLIERIKDEHDYEIGGLRQLLKLESDIKSSDKADDPDAEYIFVYTRKQAIDDGELVDVILLTLASDIPALEKEFKIAMKAVKEKVKEAAALVKEANKMALEAHAKSLESLSDVSQPLVNAMDSAGWHSSSWGC